MTPHGFTGERDKCHGRRVLRRSLDLPLRVECVETPERIEAILPELDRMIGGELITLERAQVVMYRGSDPAQMGTA